MRFVFLDKRETNFWLPRLFDLLYHNMRDIAPGTLTREQEAAQWLGEVAPALEKAPRQIIMAFHREHLAGYLQYYTRDDLLMIEEVQLEKAFQKTTAFFQLCRFLGEKIPPEIRYIEAYADSRNIPSQKLMEKLGMVKIGEASDFVRFRGSFASVKRQFCK